MYSSETLGKLYIFCDYETEKIQITSDRHYNTNTPTLETSRERLKMEF